MTKKTKPVLHSQQDFADVLGHIQHARQTVFAQVNTALADLYWQIGLANLATNHYLKAIELARIPEQLEEKTLAQFGLGEVYAALGDNNQAKIWYSKAREGYLALGDSARANFVIQLIESLP